VGRVTGVATHALGPADDLPGREIGSDADRFRIDPRRVDGDQVTGTAAQAQEVFDALERVGVDLTDVFITLEDEGVEKFEQSWKELLDTVKSQLDGAR